MNLHELNPKWPHQDLPLLTTDAIYDLIDREAANFDDPQDTYVAGAVDDMWLEDGLAYATWKHDGTNKKFVMRARGYDIKSATEPWGYDRPQLIEWANRWRANPMTFEHDSDFYCVEARSPFNEVDLLT